VLLKSFMSKEMSSDCF